MTDDIDPDETDTQGGDWRTPADRTRDIAQAKALQEQARKGGLRFEVFLPPGLAEWVLDFVERGVFVDPSEAVFVILGEHRDLVPHDDLRTEILKRSLDASINDPGPPIPLDEFEKKMAERMAQPRPEPALWRKNTYA
jgi:antitoxin ParD1/3/4